MKPAPVPPTVSSTGNEVTIFFVEDKTSKLDSKRYTLSSNSHREQIVTIKVDDESATEERITGERTRNYEVLLPKDAKKVVFTFCYQADGQKKMSAEVEASGPYSVGPGGRVHLIAIVAENGDDSDYDDTMVQVFVR